MSKGRTWLWKNLSKLAWAWLIILFAGKGIIPCKAQDTQSRYKADSIAIERAVDKIAGKIKQGLSQKHIDSTMFYLVRGIDMLKPYPNSPRYASLLNDIAEVERELGRPRQAVTRLASYLRYNNPPQRWRARIYNRIGGIYFEIGMPDSTIYFSRRSLAYNDTSRNQRLLCWNYWQMGAAYAQLHQPKPAIEMLSQARTLAAKADPVNIPSILLQLAKAYGVGGQQDSALACLDKAYMLTQAGRDPGQKNYISFEYYQALRKAGKLTNALEVMDSYLAIHDTFLKDQASSNIRLLEAKIDLANKTLENQRLQRETQQYERDRKLMIRVGGGIAALALVLALLLYYTRRQRRQLAEQNRRLSETETALKAQRQRLEELNTTKDTMLSVISHDVRGPLLTLGVALNLATEGHLSAEETRSMLLSLAGRVADTEALLSDVLLWSKGQGQSLDVEVQPTNLADIVADACQQTRPQVRSRDVQLIIIPSACQVMANAGLIKIALRNVLANAVRHGPNRGAITIHYLNKPGFCGVEIADQGSGMPRPLIERLLSPDASQTLTRREMAINGLGLILVKDFVRRMGGHLQIEASGQGTNFKIWLREATVQKENTDSVSEPAAGFA